MNSNHFNPKLSYARKLRRLKENISDLEDALQTLESLPFKTVQNLWRTIAEKDLPKKSEKTKSISKGSYKQCLKKTLQGFLNEQLQMRQEIEQKTRDIDHKALSVEEQLMGQLKEIWKLCKRQQE